MVLFAQVAEHFHQGILSPPGTSVANEHGIIRALFRAALQTEISIGVGLAHLLAGEGDLDSVTSETKVTARQA